MESPFDQNRQPGGGGHQPQPIPAPGDMGIDAIYKELGLSSLTNPPKGKNNKNATPTNTKPVNPFGAATPEFTIAPMAAPTVIQDPIDRIQSGLPEYDNLMKTMYPPQPVTPSPTPVPTPAPNPKLISGLPQAIRDRLTQIWGKIGHGATLPLTLDDFLSAYRTSRMPQPRPPRRPGSGGGPGGGTPFQFPPIGTNPYAGQGH